MAQFRRWCWLCWQHAHGGKLFFGAHYYDAAITDYDNAIKLNPDVAVLLPALEQDVEAGGIPALTAAQQLLDTFFANNNSERNIQ